MDGTSVPAKRDEGDLSAASNYGIGQKNGEDLPEILSGRGAHELSD